MVLYPVNEKMDPEVKEQILRDYNISVISAIDSVKMEAITPV